MGWEYLVQQFSMADRWSGKRMAQEVQRFNEFLNTLGAKGWEMIGYESVPMYGALSSKLKGHAYLTFMKRPLDSDGSSVATAYTPEEVTEMETLGSE